MSNKSLIKKPIKKPKEANKTQKSLIEEFSESLNELASKMDAFVYPLIIPPRDSIDEDVLFNIYPDLKAIGEQDRLHVLLYSYGGDAHTAFHIGRLLQSYAKKELKIYILREAKSAATLIATSADNIVLSEISELGPMDPQIYHPKIERRFSPLAIKHSLELLHSEMSNGHEDVARVLAEKLPDPITLGEALKSLETGKDYIQKLLSARMFKGEDEQVVRSISTKLVEGYPDHGYCIDFQEAKDIGLKVEKVSEEINFELFKLMRNFKQVWDRFEFLLGKNANNPEENNLDEAVELIDGLQKAASDIVYSQISTQQDKTTVTRKKTKKDNNGPK